MAERGSGPALDAAIDELERSPGARRMLVLVTDGFVDDAPLAELRARLDRSRIETITLAVGPDADVNTLERLVGGRIGRRAARERSRPTAARDALRSTSAAGRTSSVARSP